MARSSPFYYAFYKIDEHGDKVDPRKLAYRPDPVDFRITPRSGILGTPPYPIGTFSSGASNIILKLKSRYYLVTCQHVVHHEDAGGFIIQPFASTRMYYNARKVNWAKWNFKQLPDDFGLVLIADGEEEMQDFRRRYKVGLLPVDLYDPSRTDKGRVAVAPSLARHTANNKRKVLSHKKERVEVVREMRRRDGFKELYPLKSDRPIKHILNARKIPDTITTGDSGSAVFTEDFKQVIGLIVMDDGEFNYVNDIGRLIPFISPETTN